MALADVKDEQVGFAAVKALSHIEHPAVRALAFRLMDTRAKWQGGAVDLLAHNFQDRDHGIILRWFQEEEDREALHSLSVHLIDLWKPYPHEETEIPMMRALYEKGPSSFCREGAGKGLLERVGNITRGVRLGCKQRYSRLGLRAVMPSAFREGAGPRSLSGNTAESFFGASSVSARAILAGRAGDGP